MKKNIGLMTVIIIAAAAVFVGMKWSKEIAQSLSGFKLFKKSEEVNEPKKAGK